MTQSIFSSSPVYLRAKDAASYLGISTPTFWRWVQQAKFSRGIRQSARCTVWRREELDAYIARCEANSAE